jgi:hypothetical protein
MDIKIRPIGNFMTRAAAWPRSFADLEQSLGGEGLEYGIPK